MSTCPYNPTCPAWSRLFQKCCGNPVECIAKDVRGGKICVAVVVISALAMLLAIGVVLWRHITMKGG